MAQNGYLSWVTQQERGLKETGSKPWDTKSSERCHVTFPLKTCQWFSNSLRGKVKTLSMIYKDLPPNFLFSQISTQSAL